MSTTRIHRGLRELTDRAYLTFGQHNRTLWDIIIAYLNQNILQEVKRQDIILRCKEFGKTNLSSIDTYRNYLYRAGYLHYASNADGKKKRGVYITPKTIPTDLSVEECKGEAYGGRTQERTAEFLLYSPAASASGYYRTVSTDEGKKTIEWNKMSDTTERQKPDPDEFITHEEMEL